tara:strand:+ start:45111 stop:46079 length:969 start_codon:yes stop_codon:yes gene_type:complete
MKKINHLKAGKEVLNIEAQGLTELANSLNENFVKVCKSLQKTQGKIITLGVGKSGHVAKKVSATLSSTGSPSIFINAAEGLHGDIGTVSKDDKVLIFSHSGQSLEVLALIPNLKRVKCDFYSITGSKESPIAKSSKINLDTGISKEACPLNLAPTTSTTAALALGDAIAVVLLKSKGFKENDFALSHPGGKLGKALTLKVKDLMHKGNSLPIVTSNSPLSNALIEVSSKGLGIAIIIDRGTLKGIFTDGDLRRSLNKNLDIRTTSISKVMSKKVKTINLESLATAAIQIMNENKIYSLIATDKGGKVKGVIRMHDLIEAGLV